VFPYFQKLNITLPEADLSLDATKMKVLHYYAAAQKHSLRAKKQFENYVAIPNATYIPREEDVATLLPLLPADLIAIESPQLWCMNIKPQHKNNVLPAHRDHTRLASISFFFDTHGEETSFYEYQGSNLVKVASFVAQHGDVYLLNVDKVHDVKLAAPHIRKSLGFSFITTPFETVYDQLRKAELISGHELP
jgi:hypothetical protein